MLIMINCDIHVLFFHLCYGLWYIMANMPVLSVLPVTSQPGLGRSSSSQGLVRDHPAGK